MFFENAVFSQEKVMKKLSVIAATLVGATMLSVAPISVGQSLDKGLSLAINSAQAEVGRPLTAGSVAGVHRRHARRAVRRCAAGVTCPQY